MRKAGRSLSFISALLILMLAAAACNLPSSARSQDAASTAAALTLQADLTRRAPLLPSVTSTFPIVTTVAPPTLAPSSTFAVASATSSCDIADFIQDVTIPDGTLVQPGQAFTKTWRFKNLGSCSWTPAYSLVFSSGDQMNGPLTQALQANVNPGQTVDIPVNLTAPTTAGDYTGNWKLRNASGVIFASFWVKIRVQSAVATTPAVTQATLNAIPSESGTIYQAAAKLEPTSAVMAGDTAENFVARGFMSFDISRLTGKTISSATLNLSSCSKTLNPFSSLAGIWLGELQFALPLDQSDYDAAGNSIQLLNTIPDTPIDVKSFLQNRVNEGRDRFQVRLHPAGPSNGDGLADYISCNPGTVVLKVSYLP
ncbi:MAG: NBR1-Ig-like domain-containing protein [Bacteroidota bacterium]